MGRPIDQVFADREVFADFFTRYYTDCEPEHALVTEDEQTGAVVGYLLGCVRWVSHPWRQRWLILSQLTPRVLARLIAGRYDRQSRAFLRWVVFRASRETPPAPARSAHFHINLLPEHRTGVASREMIFQFFEIARSRGVPRIYGQIQTRDDRRTCFWTRYGFQELSRRRISKFAEYDPTPVYVTTLFRDFGAS